MVRAPRERISAYRFCRSNFKHRGFPSALLTAASLSRRYDSFSGRDGMQSAPVRAPRANRPAVSARLPPATTRYQREEVSMTNRARAEDDVVVPRDARTTPAPEHDRSARPTLRYVVPPKRGDAPSASAEKENGRSPETVPAKRPAAKRRKPKLAATGRDDPKQVTLSQVFAGPDAGAGGTAFRGTATREGDGVCSTLESTDDVELAPGPIGNAETRRKRARDENDDGDDDVDDETPRRVSRDPFVLHGGDETVSNDDAFGETFARAIRTASAWSIGVLFRDVVGRRRFGFRSNAEPEPDAAQKEAARKAARAAGAGASPPEGGWQAAVRRVPVAVGVVPLGSAVADAGDGVGGVLFAFPVIATAGGDAGDETSGLALRPEHAAALAAAARAGGPAVAFHAQAVFKALSALGVCPLPLLSRLAVLDARAMAWLHAPDATHEGGVEAAWRACFPGDARDARRGGRTGETAFRAFRRDLASAAALTQRFGRAAQSGARLRANAALQARFARTTRRESRVAALLGAMERAGIGFDAAYAERVGARFREEVETIEREADALSVTNADGSRVNLAAPAQVAEALFVTLRLPAPPAEKKKPGDAARRSTRDEVLRALASGPDAHPLARLVVRHRAALRAAATCASYVSMYEKQNRSDGRPGRGSRTDPEGLGRLRCEWNNTRTATGRLSSSNPNLQAVGDVAVAETGEAGRSDGKERLLSLRGAFVAPPGRVLLAVDYSQIELRVLAHLAGDPKLRDILAKPPAASSGASFAPKNDAFEQIWNAGRGAPASAPVTRADRAKAKTSVYGLLYGQGEAGLAHKLGVSREEAGDITRALYAAFPSLRRFVRETREDARRLRGAFLPLTARTRPLPGLGSADASARAEAERRAVNTLVQGTAADLVKLAMDRWCRAIAGAGDARAIGEDDAAFALPTGFDPNRARLVAQIHDELMFESDADVACVEAVAECARRCMEGAADELGLVGLWTPTKVTVGRSWSALAPIEAFVASARANASAR